MKSEKIIRSILAPLGILLAFLAFVFGSFLPLRKAQLFIRALHSTGEVRTLNDYINNFDEALRYYSPIGQSENTRFLLNQILQIISEQSGDVSNVLTAYADEVMRLDDSSNSRSALNYTQKLSMIGNIYEVNFRNNKKRADYDTAKAFFEKGLALSPNRPQFLYGLLQLYVNSGNASQALPIAEKIHALWPTDGQITAMLPELQKAASATPMMIISTSTATASSVEINVRH